MGKAIQIGVMRRTQVIPLEKGVDWIPQMGGSKSPFAMNYACRNSKCRCVPVRADKWMRFATKTMSTMSQDEFLRIIDALNADPKKFLTEESLKGAKVIVNPEWRCPLCITKFEK